MVNAATFDHEDVALVALLQARNGLGGHFGERWFAAFVLGPVCFVLHMRGFKEAKHFGT